MWATNCGLILAFLICMFTVDLNGNYPFVPPWASLPLTLTIFGVGVLLNIFLLVKDAQRRWLAGLCLAMFALVALPKLL